MSTDRDEGTILNGPFTVLPGQNGTFVIRIGSELTSPVPFDLWGFSSIDDLIAWLTLQAAAWKTSSHQGKAPS